jgi:signal transduction histidine kinase
MNSATIPRLTGRDPDLVSYDILVVDDNPRNLLAIDAALSAFEGRVVKASSGEAALRALLKQDFAVILLDVQMPGLDGFETARLIRTRDRCRHTPIIFVTAFDQRREEVLRGYQLGAVDFLFKPITPEILSAKVSAFVELYRHAREIARQEQRLRQLEQRAQEERIAEARRGWEAEVLRREAEASAARAEELSAIVAERERAQLELTQVVDKLELADRRKDQFLATLAHELRTPLSPISIGIDLVQKIAPEEPEIQRVLTLMRRQSNHLVRLVDDLLEASRISRGKVHLQRAPFLLADAVDHAAQMCAPLLAERRHELRVALPEEPLFVDGDRVRLTQVIANLLTNAARYTPAGGHVALSCCRHDERAMVSVRDDGRGMAPELIERVFDMFVQGSGNEQHSGLGIGLSLVRQLVELHGGSVTAESDGPGRGSTFTVWLPALADEQQPAPGSTTGTHLRGSARGSAPLSVLLVEDSEDIRELMGAMLLRAGHTVSDAADGAGALELARKGGFDVALVDIGLPDMSGVELGRQLRLLLPETRLVAVTGYGHNEVRVGAAEAGFDGYVVKPVTEETLEAELGLSAEAPAVRSA